MTVWVLEYRVDYEGSEIVGIFKNEAVGFYSAQKFMSQSLESCWERTTINLWESPYATLVLYEKEVEE